MWLFTRGYIPIYHHNITMKIIIITIFININGDLWRHTNTPRVKHGNAEMPHPAAPGGDRNTPRRSPHLAARTRTVRNPGGVRVFSNDFLGGNDGKRMGKWWENYGKIMGRGWENDGKMMGKWWENHQPELEFVQEWEVLPANMWAFSWGKRW